ncbi:hypothetical protein QYM36_005387 [Artemia franciscana]|uniref:Uncharacterized protein n=1 Tax=Artemia franciscana TaxID=6661 RepID=A0AA88LC11_ARTSF|nr:hypothetical protein QYM36_005387 [Artemia franciscana]
MEMEYIPKKEMEKHNSDQEKNQQILKKDLEKTGTDEEKIPMIEDNRILVQKEIKENKAGEALDVKNDKADEEKIRQNIKKEINDGDISVKKEKKKISGLGKKYSRIRKFYFHWLKKVKSKKLFTNKKKAKGSDTEGQIPPPSPPLPPPPLPLYTRANRQFVTSLPKDKPNADKSFTAKPNSQKNMDRIFEELRNHPKFQRQLTEDYNCK